MPILLVKSISIYTKIVRWLEILRAEWSAAARVFAECSRVGLSVQKQQRFKISALFAILFGQTKSIKSKREQKTTKPSCKLIAVIVVKTPQRMK